MKPANALIPALLVLWTAAAFSAPLALRVSPGIVEAEVQRGETRQLTITLANVADHPATVDAFPADLQLTPSGMPMVRKATGGPYSCARWIRLDTNRFTLAPGRQRAIKATMRVPTSARGGAYAVVAFRVVGKPVTTWEHVGVTVVGTTGTVLIITVKGPATVRAALDRAECRVDPDTGAVAIETDVRNTGDIHFKCSGRVVIFGPQGRVQARIHLDAGTGTVLPGGTRRLTALWTPASLQPGTYRAQFRVRVPHFRTLRRTVEFQAP